jgi:hypothetical protein
MQANDENNNGGPSLDRIGGMSGALVGAGIGSAAGPVGSIIGGVAGAIGGWWAGHAVIEAAHSVNHEDEAHFREHYDSLAERPADRAYDDVRGVYYLGQIASHHPDFVSGEFGERVVGDVEAELEKGWATHATTTHGSWASVRDYAAAGFSRGRAKLDEMARHARAEWESRHGASSQPVRSRRATAQETKI